MAATYQNPSRSIGYATIHKSRSLKNTSQLLPSSMIKKTKTIKTKYYYFSFISIYKQRKRKKTQYKKI
jgi:hypothetical protein